LIVGCDGWFPDYHVGVCSVWLFGVFGLTLRFSASFAFLFLSVLSFSSSLQCSKHILLFGLDNKESKVGISRSNLTTIIVCKSAIGMWDATHSCLGGPIPQNQPLPSLPCTSSKSPGLSTWKNVQRWSASQLKILLQSERSLGLRLDLLKIG
jgi:hypothetical protein